MGDQVINGKRDEDPISQEVTVVRTGGRYHYEWVNLGVNAEGRQVLEPKIVLEQDEKAVEPMVLEDVAIQRRKVIALCGSTRFKVAFQEWNARLTAEEGAIVLSVALWSPGDRIDPPADLKQRLDSVHMCKIDMADEVFVLDVGGYVGESTEAEMRHADEGGKLIRRLSIEHPDWTESACRYWRDEWEPRARKAEHLIGVYEEYARQALAKDDQVLTSRLLRHIIMGGADLCSEEHPCVGCEATKLLRELRKRAKEAGLGCPRCGQTDCAPGCPFECYAAEA